MNLASVFCHLWNCYSADDCSATAEKKSVSVLSNARWSQDGPGSHKRSVVIG